MNPSFISKPTSKDWPIGHVLLDDYEVVRVLGEGGMGKVYLVRSLSSGSQFAVKRAKGLNDADRKSFLAELQTWIDLPEHPNLVPCRFFRTVGTEVLIFAEYVEGGSLKDWIDSRKLYEGGPDRSLERMLDVAIQLAWGLHCVHEQGTVHQDVKPGNVLMGTNGIAGVQGVRPQVTDYGLARARAAVEGNSVSDSSRSIFVSCGGGTPAYWSPEQSQGMPLTHQTDIWSWGLSVMELFTGGVTWMSGLGAARVLEQYLQEDGCDEGIPAMPCDLVDLLRECFREDPFDRLLSLAEAVEKLLTIYWDSVGIEYNRILKEIGRSPSIQTEIKERRYASGTTWRNPQYWLEKALIAAGRDPAEASAMVARQGVTRRGELVAEMVVYDEAKRLYELLVLKGQNELEGDLATLCMGKALVHRTAGDRHGSLEEYNQAIAIRERLTYQEGRSELATALAAGYVNKADTISDLGDYSGAVALCDQAISILDRLVNQEGQSELAEGLAKTYINKASYIGALGDKRGAVELYDQVIEIRERLVNIEGHSELSGNLAGAYMNKANAVSDLGDKHGALALYDKALEIRKRLVNEEGRCELAVDLAQTYMNKANAVSALEGHRGAVVLHDQAILIGERLVNREGRRELADFLATIYINKAAAVSALGDFREAVALCDQAIAILECLVNQEGRRELADELARAYMNKGIGVGDTGSHREAVLLFDQAIAIRERLVHEEGSRELTGDLAKVLAYRGDALRSLNEGSKGLKDMLNAQGVLESEIARTGRADLKDVLNWIDQQLKRNTI